MSGNFRRSAARADGRLQAESPHGSIAPAIVPERAAALDTAADGLQFRFGLRPVHLADPVGLAGHRPGRQEFTVLSGSRCQRKRLDHFHRSARRTSFARTAFRST